MVLDMFVLTQSLYGSPSGAEEEKLSGPAASAKPIKTMDTGDTNPQTNAVNGVIANASPKQLGDDRHANYAMAHCLDPIWPLLDMALCDVCNEYDYPER